MVKATRSCAVLLGIAALWLFAASMPALAEVQNVKVGGDVTIRAFHRENLDVHDEGRGNVTGAGLLASDASGADGTGLDTDNFFMSTVGINIGADLTENVSTFVRVANERDWNISNAAQADVSISQAYVTMKELFYSPLTVKIGAQPISWGRGFVLGSNLLPSIVLGGGNDRHSAITANEFTDFTSFDAIRGTLDLSNVGGMNFPLTADYVYIKLDENVAGQPDDVNLQGINFSTHSDAMNSEAEAYYLYKRDKGGANKHGHINTLGLRGSARPVTGSNLYGEIAVQLGQRGQALDGVLTSGEKHQAWAFDLGGDYTFKEVTWKPKLGGEWIFYSGQNVDGAVAGWDPIAPGYFTTAIRQFQTGSGVAGFYPTDQTCFANGAAATSCTGTMTNQHQWSLYGALNLIEDLTVNQRLSWFATDVGAVPVAGSKRRNFIGTEWDTNVVYNYTDDVQFGVIYALFVPGSTFRAPNDSKAQELITSVSVKF